MSELQRGATEERFTDEDLLKLRDYADNRVPIYPEETLRLIDEYMALRSERAGPSEELLRCRAKLALAAEYEAGTEELLRNFRSALRDSLKYLEDEKNAFAKELRKEITELLRE